MKMAPEKEEERFKRVKDYLAGLTKPTNANSAAIALELKTATLIMLLLRHKDRLKTEVNVNIDKVGGQWVIWK